MRLFYFMANQDYYYFFNDNNNKKKKRRRGIFSEISKPIREIKTRLSTIYVEIVSFTVR